MLSLHGGDIFFILRGTFSDRRSADRPDGQTHMKPSNFTAKQSQINLTKMALPLCAGITRHHVIIAAWHRELPGIAVSRRYQPADMLYLDHRIDYC